MKALAVILGMLLVLAHPVAVAAVLPVVVIAICAALAVLAFAITGVVAESGWRTVPRCAGLTTWREA